jgi:hypothetical protein
MLATPAAHTSTPATAARPSFRPGLAGALLVLGVTFSLAGCAPNVRGVWFDERPAPRPADHPIQLYSTRVPECPYEEVGLIQSRESTLALRTPMQDVLDALRRGAREMGGDAVILRPIEATSAGGESAAPLNPSAGLGGTVIRFTDPNCQRE